MLWDIIAYCIVLYMLRKMNHKYKLVAFRRIAMLPLFIFFCTIPTFFRDIWAQFGTVPSALLVFQSFTFNIQGFLNAIAYGGSPLVFKEYKIFCCGNESRTLLKNAVSSNELPPPTVETVV